MGDVEGLWSVKYNQVLSLGLVIISSTLEALKNEKCQNYVEGINVFFTRVMTEMKDLCLISYVWRDVPASFEHYLFYLQSGVLFFFAFPR